MEISFFITKMRKYLQSDWLRGVQYWPYFFSICIFLLKKKKKSTFNLHSAKIEMYSLKTN